MITVLVICKIFSKNKAVKEVERHHRFIDRIFSTALEITNKTRFIRQEQMLKGSMSIY